MGLAVAVGCGEEVAVEVGLAVGVGGNVTVDVGLLVGVEVGIVVTAVGWAGVWVRGALVAVSDTGAQATSSTRSNSTARPCSLEIGSRIRESIIA